MWPRSAGDLDQGYVALVTFLTSPSGAMALGHILALGGIADLSGVLVIRHTFTKGGITQAGEATPDNLLAYTRGQSLNPRTFPPHPPRVWITFFADGALRSRFITAYENHGEIEAERTETTRYFDLRPSEFLASLQDRLVIEWSKGPRWQNTAAKAAGLPVLEIADPRKVPFLGFDKVLLPYGELPAMVEESRYAEWRTALAVVQGIYLITDSSNGKQYVGKADGRDGILGRWRAYAGDGHGGNVALMELVGLDPLHRSQFVFSILRVFGPEAPTKEVNAAEAHFKNALFSRTPYGYNKN